MVATISGRGTGRHRGAQPATEAEPEPYRGRVGAARGRVAAALSGLGRAQTAGAAGTRSHRADAEHDPSHSVAPGTGARPRAPPPSSWAISARNSERVVADGFQKSEGLECCRRSVVGAR